MPMVMPLSPQNWRRSQRPLAPIWGDGFIDQSLATLWYPCDWSDVGEDELVLFIPSLAADRIFASDQAGPALHIRRALAARLDSAVRLLCSRGELQTLERIAACGVISVCSPQDVLREAQSSCRSGPRYPAWEQRNDLAVWTFELSVLACIDRMLVDSMPTHPDLSECCMAKADLADVLVASIHTGFNGAYAYPQFAFAHELLGAGAWLGVLLRGRPALMPEFVAQVLIDWGDKDEAQKPASMAARVKQPTAPK